jgi:hypothetical protein
VQQQQQQQALPAPRLQPLATEQGADVTGQLAKAMSQQVKLMDVVGRRSTKLHLTNSCM